MLSTLVLPILSLLKVASAQSNAVISASPSTPDDASGVVDKRFVSFSIAIHWFRDYAGNSSTPNVFSQTIMDVFRNQTGEYPVVRVGGTSADRTTYISSQEEDIILTSGTNGIPMNVTVGPSFFSCYNSLPNDYIVDLQLERNDSVAAANMIEEAQIVVDTLGGRLQAFEIGNEPNFYPGSNRPLNFTPAEYTEQWLNRANLVASEVLDNNDKGLKRDLFQLGTEVIGYGSPSFNTSSYFAAGAYNTSLVKSVSKHLYPLPGAGTSLQHTLMNHTAVMSNISRFAPDIAFLKANYPQIPFVLGETNSDGLNLNQDQMAGVFGSALWTIDYLLSSLLAGVQRVYLHQGTTFGYSAWRPVGYGGNQPIVRAPFYGPLFVNELIGRNEDTRIARLDVSSVSTDSIVAYGAYEFDRLSKVAVINFNYWDSTIDRTREAQSFTFQVTDQTTCAKVEWLVAPDGALADDHITFQGQSWNYTTGGYPEQVMNDTMFIEASNGTVTFSLEDSSAALITLL